MYAHPARKKRMQRPEQRLQIAIFNFVKRVMQLEDCSRFIAAHCPNGGKRTKAEASIFKAMGVMAGFADIIVLIAPNEVHKQPTTIFIEMKAKDGGMEESQIYFEDRVCAMGFKYYVLEGLSEQDALNKFIAIMLENGVDLNKVEVK